MQLAPLLVLSFLLVSEVLHVNVLNIKTIDRRITQETINWHGGTYQWSELKANLSWEDAYISFMPDYHTALQHDLDMIADHMENIEGIDWDTHSITSQGYQINICILDMDMVVTDTSLFKKRAEVNMTAYLELTHEKGCEILYSHMDRNRRFNINNEFEMFGIGQWDFIYNKGYELLYTEVADMAPRMVNAYERRYAHRERMRAAYTIIHHYYYDPLYRDPGVLHAQSRSMTTTE